MKKARSSSVTVDKEGKHPIVDITKARPRSDFLETGIDLSQIKDKLKDLMHHDDAEEIIAKSADSTLKVIGAGHNDKTGLSILPIGPE